MNVPWKHLSLTRTHSHLQTRCLFSHQELAPTTSVPVDSNVTEYHCVDFNAEGLPVYVKVSLSLSLSLSLYPLSAETLEPLARFVRKILI